MREVSIDSIDLVLRAGQGLGRSKEEVLAAFGVGEKRPRRIDWDVYCAGMRWFETFADCEETVVEAGARHFLEIPAHQSMLAVLRLVTSPRDFYWVMHRWGGHGMFNNAVTEYDPQGETRVRLVLSVTGQEPPRSFFALTAGAFRAGPKALGYPESVVHYKISGNSCEYQIEHAHSRSILSRLRAMWLSMLSRGGVLDELETQKRALTEQLNELQEAHRQVQHALALRQRFLTTVAHEMRTPLAGVIGLAELLGGTTDLAEVQSLGVQIGASGTELMRLINDVIALEGEAAETPKPETTPIAAFGEHVLGGYQLLARTKSIGLGLELTPSAPASVSLDRDQVTRILGALLDNAVKFTDAGQVVLSVASVGGRLEFSIRDSGPGMPEAVLARIFEPFYQADGSLTRKGGLGFGLAVARRLARGLGGEIHVESQVGRGSTFRLSLPLVIAAQEHGPARPLVAEKPVPKLEPAVAPVAPAIPKIEPKRPDPRPVRALVVEDNPVNQKVLSRILANLGVTVEVAENGQLAVERCQQHEYDIIFMDLQMPVMDGFEATELIRRRQAGHMLTPIVAVTANSDTEFRQRATKLGMDAFLAKPVNKGAIEEAIREVTADLPRPAAAS